MIGDKKCRIDSSAARAKPFTSMLTVGSSLRYSIRTLFQNEQFMNNDELMLPLREVLESHVRKEVQAHGFIFEEWIRDTFFDGYVAKYTEEWDFPAHANLQFGALPVSIKTARYGSPVGLGDALRQFRINEPFLLIVGFWKQRGDHKNWVNITATKVQPAQWAQLWEPISLSDLQELDTCIKDRSVNYQEARRKAQALKKSSPFSEALITLNPKIDSKQRRLQCSLRFKVLFDLLAPEAERVESDNPRLFAQDAPTAFPSSPRKFNRARKDQE
jgi:hypothetical protein